MDLNKVRKKYISFFEKHKHVEIPSASLVPENDPTTLFTGSGMQPLVPYLLGETHPKGTRLVDSQKCFRSGDIDEVGDNRHTTFFEMLGNWSLGDYFKNEQLPWFFSFLTDELGLDPERLYVTVFSGDASLDIGPDEESVSIWKTLFKEKGIQANSAEIGSEEAGGKRGMKDGERIFYYDVDKNWWSRAGAPAHMPVGEIGGPDSEVFYEFPDVKHDKAYGEHCHPNCDCGRFLEIGNSVFIQYIKNEDGTFSELPNKNVDFGGGLERILMVLHNEPDIIAINHKEIITFLEGVTGKTYGESEKYTRAFRIIADHMKAAVFLISEGVHPSNTDQGYFVRRLIRRSVRYSDVLGMSENTFSSLVKPIAEMYASTYPALTLQQRTIEEVLSAEETKFRATLAKGMKEFNKISSEVVSGEQAFTLFSTYGFPFEMTQELAEEQGKTVDGEGFEAKMKEHQALSRAGSEQKFKGGLADGSEKTTMYHTCTHLLLAGLRKYLGDDIHQAGSNITNERARFDFVYPERVPREVLDKVEVYVNDIIRKKCPMNSFIMSKAEAQKSGVVGCFWDRYPDEVTVYSIEGPDGTVYSKELCGGPHVKNTGDIKGTFRIVKESSSSAGVRRVKAVLE
jgi:alanyl-tRNA synthetase